MARKSRRTQQEVIVEHIESVYPTAIYARLSLENSGKDDGGASIENQIAVCKEYIDESDDLELIKVYQDNGWTGTKMERPAFEEMMNDVRKGKIKAIVVRDLSRFARNYIETGTYLEKVFPDLNVRFISVKEQFDNLKVDGTNESLIVPLQSLINELYSKDISRKVSAAYKVMMENNTFSWRQLPYGYKLNEDHTNIVPDKVTAPFVVKMYELKCEGKSFTYIARLMNEINAPRTGRSDTINSKWNDGGVKSILTNEVYMGDRVLGKTKTALYMGLYYEKQPESEWYVYENNHEPIVSREIFYKVQEKIAESTNARNEALERSRKIREKMIDLLKGKVFCADCGYKMRFHRHIAGKNCKEHTNYECTGHNKNKHICPTLHFYLSNELYDKVLEAIRLQIKVAVDYDKLIKALNNSKGEQGVRNSLKDELRRLSGRISNLQSRRTRLYEDYVDGILNEEEYIFAKKNYESEYDSLNKQHEILAVRYQKYCEAISSDNKWISMMKSVRSAKVLTKELADTVIDKVFIYDDKSIEIVMNYQDIYDDTVMYLEQIKEAVA